jgi:hypothetical protein
MTGTAAVLADLLAECDAHGIRLALADGGGLEIDAPQNALTPKLLSRLKAHKADLLAMLRPTHEAAPSFPCQSAKPRRRQRRRFVDAVQRPGATCRFMAANPSDGIAAVVGSFSTFLFGTDATGLTALTSGYTLVNSH